MKALTKGVLILLLCFPALYSCENKSTEQPTENKTDDVVELAIRLVKPTSNIVFTSSRDSFVSLLLSQPGAFNNREYKSFLHYNPNQDTSRAVYVGMTQYENLETFQKIQKEIGTSIQANNFFSTFDALTFTLLKPNSNADVDISKIASGSQVLEIAVRDLSKYQNFDKKDYEKLRDAFLSELAKQPARVAEYQWKSVLDTNMVVGMTVYKSQQEFFQLLSDPNFAGNPAVINFLSKYPPTNYGEVCTVIK